MTITAKVVADSISQDENRITTMQLTYPRFIHAEFMTHRVFSRNASSSRAIPVAKMIAAVRSEPAMPIHWGANQPGMQANGEIEPLANREYAKALWSRAANQAADISEQMQRMGLHKQVANRILEPFQHIHVVVTATEWDNFYALRDHPAADPNICALAQAMKAAHEASTPVMLLPDEWHLPYVDVADGVVRREIQTYLSGESGLEAWTETDFCEVARKVSAARCCRVSYLKHDGERASIQDEVDLCDKLAGSVPIHASPFEHQATPADFEGMDRDLWGNFFGWIQSRKLIENYYN
jgi:hypothetical protein